MSSEPNRATLSPSAEPEAVVNMSDQHEKLKATVRELEDELRSFATMDDETRGVLREVLGEIHAVLGGEDTTASQQQSWRDRLSDAAYQFEGAHPAIAGVIRRLMDGLAQMGI